MTLEKRQGLSQQWYSEHGWLTVHVCGFPQTIGEPLRGIHWEARDLFLSEFRWRVIGVATEEEIKSVRRHLGTEVDLPFRHPVYKIEAMD